jgi:3-deoxy-D-manno-octulosonate 8-phosphate phosphatase (KDO 8-P phosphatase)
LSARRPTPLAEIELLVLDVDGVLTDGRLYFSARGEAQKAFHVRDGHGIKLLMRSGVTVAVASGRRSAAVAARMREPLVVSAAHWVSALPGGAGAVRELCDELLRARAGRIA